MAQQRISPRQFMKARRPERFSDSVGLDAPLLDRSQLEYHLSSLTSRSQELQFETFARRLLEHTVCPNLLPHTGPTGGGDSKVDTETYPVAETFAMAWYVGDGNQAATERWAFAFSAKEKWKPKLESDVDKIVATQRGYKKAFFVSSRFIPDRVRSASEDALSKEHGIDVRIFDRNWILDRIFGDRLEQLAIDDLGLTVTVRREIRKGPLDTEREQDLQYIEERITAALREARHNTVLVDDSIEAADLARSLERPRTEVDGLYMRAIRLAKQFGSPHQQLQSVYQHAWTSFWWYEDYDQFIERYTEVQALATGSRNAHELELWNNLHFLLYIAVRDGNLDAKTIDLKGRTATLLAELSRLAQEQDRPSTALQARTSRMMVRLLVELHKGKQTAVDRVLRELAGVVRESARLIGYPFDSLVQTLTELGDTLGERQTYENLFETIVQVTTEREGELRAGRMLLTRGAQQMDGEQQYEAIRTLGRALGKLYKHESRSDAVRALYLCARAYESVGLLWAARGTMLAAASVATDEFWKHDEITLLQAVCYNRLKWIELQLGRTPHILVWHQLDRAVRVILAEKGYDAEELFEDETAFDATTGMLLLRADMPALDGLLTLPDVLDGLALPYSSTALKYALGHENEVPPELLGAPETLETPIEVFRRWRDQPAASDLPSAPLLYTEQDVNLTSAILGCRINVSATNQPPCVELAESLVAALESLLATGMLEQVIAREPILTVNIRLSNFAPIPFDFHIEDKDGRPDIEIGCSAFNPHALTREEQSAIKGALFNVLAGVAARVFFIDDPKQFFTRLFRDDLASQRALDFTTSFVVVGNVLGHEPDTTLEAWVKEQPAYPLLRSEPWDAADRRLALAGTPKQEAPVFADPSAEPPPDLLDLDRTGHHQMMTVSIIRESLWRQAEWNATGFVVAPGSDAPPLLALLFQDMQSAAKIFAFWRTELGETDEQDKLRLSIIRRVSRTHPYMYRVVVASNIDNEFAQQSKARIVLSMSKPLTMNPASDKNLEMFLSSYQRCGSYILGYGSQRDNGMVFGKENFIRKHSLIIREAWEVGLNDLDCIAIHDDDDPVIPEEQKNAPVLKLLNKRRPRRRR